MSDTNISVCSKLCSTILQCILSLITVLLKWCFFLIWITSFIFNVQFIGQWTLFSNFVQMNEFSPVWDPSFQCESLQEYFHLWEKYSLNIECNTKLLDVTLEDSYRRQAKAMDIFDKFITKTSPGKIEDSSSRKGNLGVHDSIVWLISSMSLKFHIKLPRVPLKIFFGESIFLQWLTQERTHSIVHFSVWW